MILEIVKSFCELVEFGFRLRDRVWPPADRQAISGLLQGIGQLLQQVSHELEQNRYPHDRCGEMWNYMNTLHQQLQGKIDAAQLQLLTQLIKDCYQVEKLLGQMQLLSQENKQFNLHKLLEASGAFKSAGEMIKI